MRKKLLIVAAIVVVVAGAAVLTFVLRGGEENSVFSIPNEPDPSSAFIRIETERDIGGGMEPQLIYTPMLEDVVRESDCVVTATFGGYVFDSDFYYELKFHVDEAHRGATEAGSDIMVLVPPINKVESRYNEDDDSLTYCFDEYNFVEGSSYLLVLDHEKSVYLDHDRYTMILNTYIPMDTDVGMYMQFEPLSERVADDDVAEAITESSASARSTVFDYVMSLCDESDPPVDNDPPFTLSTDMNDIIETSECVLKIEVDSINNHSFTQNTDQCVCSVLGVEKSDSDEPSGQIYVKFFGDTVAEGEQYYILANRVGPQSLVFVLSSRNSVIPVDDETAVQELLDSLTR